MGNQDRYMDSFFDDDEKPISMAAYLQGEGLRLEKEISCADIYAERKRQFWVDQVGKTISACDGRGTSAVGRLVAVIDGAAVSKSNKGYNGDAVALRLDIEAGNGVDYWPAGMCRVIAFQL